jgi:hypothetical protein
LDYETKVALSKDPLRGTLILEPVGEQIRIVWEHRVVTATPLGWLEGVTARGPFLRDRQNDLLRLVKLAEARRAERVIEERAIPEIEPDQADLDGSTATSTPQNEPGSGSPRP